MAAGDDYILRSPSLALPEIPIASAERVGPKGAGLLHLPPDWYPHTLFLRSTFPDRARGNTADGNLVAQLQMALNVLAPQGQVYVRSNADSEDIRLRGQLESFISDAVATKVVDWLQEVRSTASNMDRSSVAQPRVGVLVEPLIDVQLSGHLSNEYRVSRESGSWQIEWHSGSQISVDSWRVNVSEPAGDGPLIARSIDQLETALRRVAKRLSTLPYRHHLEWVWDNRRLWIVQADRVRPTVGTPPGDAWEPTRGVSLDVESLDVFCLFQELMARDSGAKNWKKVASLHQFYDVGLPVPQVWCLAGEEHIESLRKGSPAHELLADLEALSSGHVVVRCDVRSEEAKFMLPKTEATANMNDVVAFLTRTTRQLIEDDGVPAGNIVFLIHRFLRARACAWSLARPNSRVVQIDSIWGLTDGLNWLPHDIAVVNAETGQIRRRTLGKTAFLDVSELAEWEYRESPSEWIWRESATDDQLRVIAAGARSLATAADRPLLTMWFVGLLDGASAECLPWFQAPHVPESLSIEPADLGNRQSLVISAAKDLSLLENQDPGIPTLVILRPTSELVRDKRFVERVIDACVGRDVIVRISGSPLAHPFYMLQHAGVSVFCEDRPPADEREFNKLVRDNIPRGIEARGESAHSYVADESEFAVRLQQKLLEESFELLRSGSRSEAIEEMADVSEVLESLRLLWDVDEDSVRERMLGKRAQKGAFRDRVILTRTSSTPDIERSQTPLPGLEWEPARTYSPVTAHGPAVRISLIPPVAGRSNRFVVTTDDQRIYLVRYDADHVEVSMAADRSDSLDGQPPLEGLYG